MKRLKKKSKKGKMRVREELKKEKMEGWRSLEGGWRVGGSSIKNAFIQNFL